MTWTYFQSSGAICDKTGAVAPANFQNKNDPINAAGKFPFKCVGDTTLGKPLFAAGSANTASWVDATGATVYTPS